MQNDKNNDAKLTRSELLAEIEKQKAIIAAKERGAIIAAKERGEIIAAKERGESVEDVKKTEESPSADENELMQNAESSEESERGAKNGKNTVWKIVGKTFYVASAVILSLILVANVYMIFARKVFKKQNPTIFGIGYAVVLTDSMNGDMPDSIPGNSLIFTKKQKSYEVGDVITFETDKMASVTHRIIALEDGKFVTKGDANNKEDDERVEKDDVVGKVFLTVKGAGGFIRALTTPIGLLILSCLILAPVGIPYLFGYYDEED